MYIFIFVPVWQDMNISLTPVSRENYQNITGALCSRPPLMTEANKKARAWPGEVA